MLLFAAPTWLWFAAAAGAAGAWLLVSGRGRVRAVSSLKLWKGLGAETQRARRRRIDPLWLLVFCAMLLAGLALAGPQWRAAPADGAQSQPAKVQWAARTDSASGKTELWAKSQDQHLPPAMWLGFNGDYEKVTAAELHRGVAVQVPGKINSLQVNLRESNDHDAGGEGQSPILSLATLESPDTDRWSFGLLSQSGEGDAIDPALWRVFAVRAGALQGDAAMYRAVLVVDDPQFSMDSAPANVRLVVAGPETPLPGLVPGNRLESPDEGWRATAADQNAAGVPVPDARGLESVRIRAMREASLSPEWRVLATADGKPWIAARKWQPSAETTGGGQGAGESVWLIWLASEPASETNWPKDPSFVVFFGAWADRALADSEKTAGAAEAFVDWQCMPQPTPGIVSPVPVTPLSGFAASAAAGLGLLTAGWFLWRGRNY